MRRLCAGSDSWQAAAERYSTIGGSGIGCRHFIFDQDTLHLFIGIFCSDIRTDQENFLVKPEEKQAHVELVDKFIKGCVIHGIEQIGEGVGSEHRLQRLLEAVSVLKSGERPDIIVIYHDLCIQEIVQKFFQQF